MRAKSHPTVLYDPKTARVIRAAQNLPWVIGIAAVVCGALTIALHDDLPFLAYWAGACSPEQYAYECEPRRFYGVLAGVGMALLFGVFGALLSRYAPDRPTIKCRRCGVSGWVLDIEPHGGVCPRCGGDRFDYRIWFGGGTGAGPRLERVVEDDVLGADLVRRFQETRKSLLRRYY